MKKLVSSDPSGIARTLVEDGLTCDNATQRTVPSMSLPCTFKSVCLSLPSTFEGPVPLPTLSFDVLNDLWLDLKGLLCQRMSRIVPWGYQLHRNQGMDFFKANARLYNFSMFLYFQNERTLFLCLWLLIQIDLNK